MTTLLLASIITISGLVWLSLTAIGLPGNWLMVGTAAVLSWLASPHDLVHPYTLLAAALFALLGEALELVAGLVGARKTGATRAGSVAALVGSVLGGIVGTFVLPVPLVGTLLGAAVGAAILAAAVEASQGIPGSQAAKAAIGAGLGRLVGSVMKLLVGVAIWLVLTVAAFWP